MKLPRSVLDAYNKAIKQSGDSAEVATRKALNAWLDGHPGASIAQIREVAIAIMDEFGTVFGQAAGDAAYAMRSIVAEAAGVEVEPDAYAYMPDEEYVRKTAKYQIGKLIDGDRKAFVDAIADGSRYFAERGANDTMAHFAKVDKGDVRFARVPMGATTCPYCLMLASRGFVYRSEARALNANHRHCDCRIIEGFAGMEVEGYDPEKYYDMWKHPEKYAQQTVQDEDNEPTHQAEERNTGKHSQEVKDAVEYYASGEGMYVNQFIRRGQYNSLTDDEKELVKMLDEATQTDVVDIPKLYRSVDASSVFGSMSQIEFEQLQDAIVFNADYERRQTQHIIDRAKPGKVITEKGFMSTSEDYDVVSDWYDFTGSDKPMTLELSVPEGTRGCKVYEMTPEVEESDPQREVLLPRNTKYRIADITTKDGLIYVKADIVS